MNILSKEICAPAGTLRVWGRLRNKEDEAIRRWRGLKRVDRELEKGNFKAALSLAKQLQGKPDGLRGFGAVKLVPKRISVVDELELNDADKMSLHSSVDSILHLVKCCRQFALEEKVGAFLGQDSLTNGDCCGSLSDDRVMCLQHEAGHFVVGYLLGILPKRYRVPSMEELEKDNLAGGKVEFLGFEFLQEVSNTTLPETYFTNRKHSSKEYAGIVSSKTLNRFLCVILGGLAAELLMFGYSELLHSDVDQLDRVMSRLGYSTDMANSQIKWAAINILLILRRHHKATSRVAEAMALGRSIGFCIDAIETDFGTTNGGRHFGSQANTQAKSPFLTNIY
ncbi:uncharacterized protein LOC113761540 isoform X1 [Coffea eugenioides]|uniref:uncharacterized protein LOC113761540 isoform X1 n=1 Tax=Coffea eugenioides TaxID=49369 RepID=UPI000F605C6B|nr:uncharacterized protein LOC113761540 isoform X1 [Coffea eugenioides]